MRHKALEQFHFLKGYVLYMRITMNLSETSESTSLAMGERINFARSCSQRVTYRRNFRTYIERYTIASKLSIKKQFHPIHVKIVFVSRRLRIIS